jgi:hypothetical protein
MRKGTSLRIDYNLTEDMLDTRMFPRIFALAEQMWSITYRLPYDMFLEKVTSMRGLLTQLGVGGNQGMD